MRELIRPIAESIRVTDFFVDLVTGDLTNEEAVRRVRGDEGPSISWTLGHLCHGRCEMVRLLGAATDDPYEEQFDRLVAATDGSEYPDIVELRKSWGDISARVWEVFDSVTDEQLLAPISEVGAPHDEKNVLGVLVYVVWHEIYHVGQIGSIRTQLGFTPTIDLAIREWQASG